VPVTPKASLDDAAMGKLLLVLLALFWGLNWPALRIALDQLTPWSARLLGYSIGAATLAVLLKYQGRSFHIPPGRNGRNWIHLFIAGMLNVVAFGLFGTFAQLSTDTTRVVIINYSMPIWASLMAWAILHERPNKWVAAGLALCVAGIGVLVIPAAAKSLHEPTGLILAFFCALSWASGTIYMKAVRIEGDLLAVTMWQIASGAVVFGVCFLIVRGPPVFETLQWQTWAGVFYSGCFGTAFAYFIWYNIIGKVSTATASLGTLANPVVGVIGSVILLGERPTSADWIGFALIFAAAACVLLQPRPQAGGSVPA
jgi:drug/metabolite transporter (DMT)-like permease